MSAPGSVPTHRCLGLGHAPLPRVPPTPRSTAPLPNPESSHAAARMRKRRGECSNSPGLADSFPPSEFYEGMRRTPMIQTRLRGVAAFVLFTLVVGAAAAQQPADPEAEVLLNTARKAYADANPQFAAEKFREFLTKFGTHKEAHSARYGLGLALSICRPRLPESTRGMARRRLMPPSRAGELFRGRAVADSVRSCRGSRPNEMPQRQQSANAHFTEAGRFFEQSRRIREENTGRCRVGGGS